MGVKHNIKSLFAERKELSISEITQKLGVSKQIIHRIIKKLVEDQLVIKLGSPPKTLYRINDKQKKQIAASPKIDNFDDDYLNSNFLLISETGEFIEGIAAFNRWSLQRKLPVLKTLSEYKKTKKKHAKYYDENKIIDGTVKLHNSFGEATHIDKVFYLDFYAIERFGKTRLGTLLHFAKQGQNKFLMSIMIDEIREKIDHFIGEEQFDAVAFVPPTIKREVQIMKFIQDNLNIALPVVKIKKINGIIPVPQKSLNKIEQRINNATDTFAVTEQRQFKKVLLIDDAVGSGATLNQIAEKIKLKKVGTLVIGLAIVGSFKGFDVITDI
ncbi:MAG: HTH domain-containing protein [Flavobacteriales bacterium]|nr:HTH domain-containing protein [Flavobacteriales bacterium]